MMLEVLLSIEQIAGIFSKVQIDPVTGCWNWLGATSGGYGNVRYGGRSERVHRIVYAWTIGPIPKQPSRKGPRGQIPQLDHAVCQNTRCCNPVHLELVTQRVNIMRGNGPCAKHARKTQLSKRSSLTKRAERES